MVKITTKKHVWPHVAPCPFIAYFPKKNYSRRQIILNFFEGLRKVSYISPNLCFFFVLLKLGLDWEKVARRIEAKQQLKSDRTWHRTVLPSIRSVHLRNCCWRRTRCWIVFAQRPVRRASASGLMRVDSWEQSNSVERPVTCHRTHLIVIWAFLDLSILDQTLIC